MDVLLAFLSALIAGALGYLIGAHVEHEKYRQELKELMREADQLKVESRRLWLLAIQRELQSSEWNHEVRH